MRFHLLGLILLAGTAMPAAAQSDRIDRRVERLEQEMQAVQRRVFPGSPDGGYVEPEIVQARPSDSLSGIPASNAVADLTARVDALESQLARLTGQIEESSHRLRQLEEGFTRFQAEADSRLMEVERRATAPAPEEPAPEEPVVSDDAAPPAAAESSGDAAEDAYLAGYRLWDQGQYAQAQAALAAMAKKYPKHRRASWANNLLGRAYLDDGKPATAAKVLLANYQDNPRGERAADSLYFLGQALVALKKPADACKVYDELADVYPDMRAWVKDRLPKARADAECGG